MNRYYIFLIGLLMFSLQASSQMFILNEDFSGSSGTTPPTGWTNILITGNPEDEWHFDNPGDRILNYPITEPFAIFDSENISANGVAEVVALQTSLFDASTSNYILLNFDHVLAPGNGGTGTIEAYDGNNWLQVAQFTAATANPASEIVDLSGICGGISNARIRFIWSGNGSGYWAIDNIRIYASLPLDCGVVSLDNPSSPVVPGPQNVEITLGNFGYNTLTSTKVDWTIDGVPQTTFNWFGSISFGQKENNVVIGSYDFQDPVMIKIWQYNPNGQTDINPYNDTISKYLVAALCGTYTVGGSNPDFDSFGQVAEVLNTAGITCPVTFLVRDGTYYEQFELRNIQGASETNTITFQSESGDSSKVLIKIIPEAQKYESMIYLNGSRYITFQDIGLATGSSVSYYNNAILINGAENIKMENCYFETRNQFDFGINIEGSSHDIEILQNNFECISAKAGAIVISGSQASGIEIRENYINGATEWGSTTIRITDLAHQINITGNELVRCFRAIYLDDVDSIKIQNNEIVNSSDGVYVDQQCSNIEISGNRFKLLKGHQSVPEGTSGILVKNSTYTSIFNNFIQTTGEGPVIGITLENTTNTQLNFNSINTTNTDPKGKSKGLFLQGNNQVFARNNILRVKYAGTPVYISQASPQLDFDRNDYYSSGNTIGYYNGASYDDISSWSAAAGMDINSMSVLPFFTSDTDLSINQVLLNNSAVPVNGIDEDIDGTPRDPVSPDMGAKEYNPCSIDAGINSIVSPQNPLSGGVQQVSVLLQNQGSAALNNAVINWSVNDQLQTPSPWSGSLPAGTNTVVAIGNYNFQPGILYTLKAWTSQPNNVTDCNFANDTISSQELAVPLCGDYTIGGTSPDFTTVNEAVKHLNLAGVTCPVTLYLRDGTYRDQLVMKEIPGSSAINTVTFRSQSADSTKAIIQILQESQRYESLIYLENSGNIIFKDLGLFTGSLLGYGNKAILMEGTHNVTIEGCYLEVRKDSDTAIVIQDRCQDITVMGSRLESFNAKAIILDVFGANTREINIQDNSVKGATDFGTRTFSIHNESRLVTINGNHFDRCFRAIYVVNCDSTVIRNNTITNTNEGILIDNWSSEVEISGNRLSDILSHINAPDGTNGISVFNVSKIKIFNNFIHTSGAGAIVGINLQNVTQGQICFNSINITNDDVQDKSKGVNIKTCSNIQVKNNIFNLLHSGTPVYISTTLPNSEVDRNDYKSNKKKIGYYLGNIYADLASWRAATNMDQNSMSVAPFYTSAYDLSINQILLNNTGIPIAGITTDIDGNLRNPATPDIGAKEYEPCAVDAGINAMLNPETPLTGGLEDVSVMLQNQGTSTLTSVQINWSVNDEAQAPYAWTGNLASASNTEVVLGQYDFIAGLAYALKIWTSEPNNATDCNHLNDTLSTGELAGPLCGTYTIGGDEADFYTFSQVAEVLNTAGITCPVTFLVRDGIYYDKIIIREIAGASTENTITFKSESSDSSLVTLKIIASASNFEPMISMVNTRHVRFENIGLSTGSTSSISNYAIQMSGAEDIILQNCLIQARNENDYGIELKASCKSVGIKSNRFECTHTKSGAINLSGAQVSDVEIVANMIYGAAVWGNTLVKAGPQAKNIMVNDNYIDRSFRAIYFIGSDSIQITHNTIKNTNSGIYIDNGCTHANVSSNRLINVQSYANLPNGTSGIMVLNSINTDVINNFVQTAGQGPVLGITLQDADTCRALFNSININNTDPQGKSKGIYINSSNNILGRNNIFNIKSTGIPIHIDLNVTYLNLDYNNYYSPSGIIGKVNDVTYSNLNEWGMTIQGDANSLKANPYFKADTIPLPYQKTLNGAGITVAGVQYDIDGKLRHIQAPDIGCLEFFVDFGVLELLSPTLECFHPNVDSVKVYVRQFGDVPFDRLVVCYKIDEVGIVHKDTVEGPLIFDFIHTFQTTETLTTYGDYTFTIWLEGNTDDNINNDILVAHRYSKPAPEVTIDYDNQCTGWEVYFTGTASVTDPYYIDGYEWFFGDGDTSYLQNPVHEFDSAGTYDVILRAYSDAGCYSETSRTIVIDSDFQGLSLDYDLQNEVCIGDGSGRLELMGSGGTPPYNYYVNGIKIEGHVINQLQPGVYSILMEDAKQCSRTDTVESLVLVDMNPQIQAHPGSGIIPLTVDFAFTADSAESWTWYFPDSYTDTSATPSYTFLEYGFYTIILEVNSGPPYYCIDREYVDILADIIITIDANNVFTPNGDGANDFFEITSYGIEEMHVKIFNQWGGQVYEIDEVDGKWDGTTKSGAEAADGTYYWSLKAKGINQQEYDRQGSVLLLRHGADAYPNPVTAKVNVKTYESLQAPITVSVYSVFGQLAHSEIIYDADKIIVDLSHLESGIYIMKMDDGARNSYVRIIKN